MRIKVDDTVVVLSGKDSGKKGRVTSVDLEENKVVVDGVNVVNRHVRRSQRNMQGGRLSKTMPVPAGKVMLVCPVCGKPTRVGYRFVEVTVKKESDLLACNLGCSLGGILVIELCLRLSLETRIKRLNKTNIHSVPKLEKIVVNMGVGSAIQDKKYLEEALDVLTQITGQKPVITQARRSIAGFRLREGMNIGCKVTLRGARMYEFMDRLISIVLPRVRDFRGLNPNSFDRRGNYNLGLAEQLVFPELNPDKYTKSQGMNITFVTNVDSDDEARELLRAFGMPFKTGKEN